MIVRAASVVFAGLVLVGCALSWTPITAYDGPELASSEFAVIRSRSPDGWVYRVSREGVTYYQANNRNDSVEIRLRPGYYQVTLAGQCPRWSPSRYTYGATLSAEHTYRVRIGGCFSIVSETFNLWLEDVATGEDVTRSKTIPITLSKTILIPWEDESQ